MTCFVRLAATSTKSVVFSERSLQMCRKEVGHQTVKRPAPLSARGTSRFTIDRENLLTPADKLELLEHSSPTKEAAL